MAMTSEYLDDLVFAQVAETFPVSAAKVAEELGVPRPRVSRSLKRLVDNGELTKAGNTRATQYSVA